MRVLEITALKSYKPTNLKEIYEFEHQINAKLPQAYVEFLLQYNGGRPKQDAYHMIEPTHETLGLFEGVEWFYTLAEDEIYNLQEIYKLYLDRLPKELIPIASDGFANQICLAVRGDNYGKVYFWDHDWEAEEGEEPTYSNVYLIANSFAEFIDKLYEFNLED
jgi:hypothetical protein